jgi:uncharacterized protein YeaO (DUF488 family)
VVTRIGPVQVKRAYEPPAEDDGTRVLVDRLWPRGLTKEKARIDWWAKDLAPSTALRQWFHHDETQWDLFVARYRAELKAAADSLARLRDLARTGPVTLVYASKNEDRNNATVLRDVVLGKGE